MPITFVHPNEPPLLELEVRYLHDQNAVLLERELAYQTEIAGLKTTIAQRDIRIEDLERQLERSSKNSSKPPSSDFLTKPDVPKKPSAPRGGKKGHVGSTRKDYGTPDRVFDLLPETCDHCGTSLKELPVFPGHRHQVAEWADRPIEIREYHHLRRLCPCCHKSVEAPYPLDIIPGSRLGPKLIAHLALLNRYGHMAVDKLAHLLNDDFGIPITETTIENQFQRLQQALMGPYQILATSVRLSPHLKVDETGWRIEGERFFVWTFGSESSTYLKIAKTRGQIVLDEVLGKDYAGVISCDFYAAYDRYLTQRCLAHLRRDLKDCLERKSDENRAFAMEALSRIAEAWELWRSYHEGLVSLITLRLKGLEIRTEFRQFLDTLPDKLPEAARLLKKRFLEYWNEIWYFLDHPEVAPENNGAERSLRPIVTFRKMSGGSRSLWGAELTAMLFSVTDTCRKQERNAHAFLVQALLAKAHPGKVLPPSFLPTQRE